MVAWLTLMVYMFPLQMHRFHWKKQVHHLHLKIFREVNFLVFQNGLPHWD